MRRYALVIFDNTDQIIDRFNLINITNPTGNGFRLSLSLLSTDIEDVITKVTEVKQVVKFTINQHQNAYTKSNLLAQWIQKYSKPEYIMAIEYDDGNIIKYAEGKVIALDKTEQDEFKILPQLLEFQKTTPYFIKRENTITIQVVSVGKRYPYTYPYSYGANVIQNNEIENPYILDVPLIITINGAIDNPRIMLLDENGNSYNKVYFGTNDNPIIIKEGEKLVINSAQKKIFKVNQDGTETDYVNQVLPSEDTYLRAKTGKSTININTETATEGFKLTGSWRQYTL